MTISPIDIAALILSILSIAVAVLALIISVGRWHLDWRRDRRRQRLELLRDLFSGFSSHNWKFIQHWDFPGVFPPLKDIMGVVPKQDPKYQKAMGERVVALEHLNVLLKVFAHEDLLDNEDVIGFANWANNWFDDSTEALRVIFRSGDTYPLDFIIWLREKMFKNKEFNKLLGQSLEGRLRDYESRRT